MRTARVVLATLSAFGLVFAIAGPASAETTIAVSPDTDLVSGNTVHVSGTGMPANKEIFVCEGVIDTSPSISDCGGNPETVVTTPTGDYALDYSVTRFIKPASSPTPIDCAASGASCGIGAADIDAFSSTLARAPITFRAGEGTPRPDIMIKGVGKPDLLGDNVYNTTGADQSRTHATPQGERWSYPLRVQNDGDVADTLVVRAEANFEVRYFVGPYNVTAAVTGAGFQFTDVPAGETRSLAMQFRTETMSVDDLLRVFVRVHSDLAPELEDAVVAGVRVRAPA